MGLLRRLKRGTAIEIDGPCKIECLDGTGMNVRISARRKHRISIEQLQQWRRKKAKRSKRRDGTK